MTVREDISLYNAPNPIPANIGITCPPPFSPATKTSAQATPSGYGSFSLTTKILLKLIENKTPIVPPTKAMIRVLK